MSDHTYWCTHIGAHVSVNVNMSYLRKGRPYILQSLFLQLCMFRLLPNDDDCRLVFLIELRKYYKFESR